MIKRDKFKRLLAVVFWLLATAFGLGLVATGGHAGTAYYFDPTASSSTNVGTYANPFRTLDAVNAKAFATGDDLYFKVGTTFTASDSGDYLNIDWDGSSGDQVIIGAYYGDGLFGLNGNARPVIDGAFKGPGANIGMINRVRQVGYVTVQDLYITNVTGIGILLGGGYSSEGTYPAYNHVLNCYTKFTTAQGILLSRSSYGLIYGNTVELSQYNTAPMAGIEVSANITAGNEALVGTRSIYNIIRGNRVIQSYEGIGVYSGASRTLVEDNIVQDCRSFHLYHANTKYGIWRNNIAFENASNQVAGDSVDYLLVNDCEGTSNPNAKVNGYWAAYQNVLAGGWYGIVLINNAGNDGYAVRQSNNYIFNNTLVDNISNFRIMNLVAEDQNNSIRNNISWVISSGAIHSNTYSPLSVVWDNNNFSSVITGNAATNAQFGTPGLVRAGDWRSLPTDLANNSDWGLTLSSINLNAGGYHAKIVENAASSTSITLDTSMPVWPGDYLAIDSGADGDIDINAQVVATLAATSVNWDTNVVTLTEAVTVSANDLVYIKKDSATAPFYTALDRGGVQYYDYPNQRPVIVGPGDMTVEPTALAIDFQATVTDPDGDTVTTVWDFTTSGAFVADYTGEDPGERAIIDPSSYPTTYTITITATDEHGLSNTHSFDIQVIEDSESTTCQEYYAPSLVADASNSVGRYNTQIVGFRYTPAANISACSVYVWNRVNGGSPTGNIILRAYELNESDQIASVLSTSSVIAASTMSNSSWIGPFTFSGLSIASGTKIGFGWFRDTDDNLDDTPEYDGTNYVNFGFDNENNADTIQTGTITWQWGASFPYSVGAINDAEDDMVVKIYTLQATPETVALQDIVGVTPNGTYKEGDTIQVALQFNLPATLTDANSNTTKNMTLTGESGDGTDITLTHSSPAFDVASSLHYFTGTVPSGAATADLTITAIALNGDGMAATIDIPTTSNLDDNADIVFDTSAPAIASFYACDEDGVQITDTTLISTVTSGYVCMESDGDSIFFADGPLGNLTLSLANIVPAVTAHYLSGIGTGKLIFKWDSVAGNRGTDAAVAGTDAFDPTPTVLRDQAGNALTLTLPNTWLIDANELNFAVPKSLLTGSAWWIGTGGDGADIGDLTLVPGDRVLIRE